MAFLANQILGIPRSQIEIKRFFSLVEVWKTLLQFCLQLENLDKIITIVKNWLYDSCMNCIPNKNMKDYLKAKASLVDDNNELLKKKNILKSWMWIMNNA
jgi:hypothetical protein